MESRSRRTVLKAGVAAFGLVAPIDPFEGAARKEYVCPPCNCGLDHEVSDKPGTCRACGMTLVEKGTAAATPSAPARPRVRAAVLVFDGVQVIDFAAPYEVFGQAGYEVFTVAAEARPVLTAMGLRVTPRYTLADAPSPQIVLVPGGDVDVAQQDARVLDWIRAQAGSATHVVSVCNGAFILAAAGLLDGQQATTFYDLIEALRIQAPKAKVVSDRRFVDNGKVITTAGLSSGIDGALHVVSRVSGAGSAQMAALNMEYDWKADGQYARASFADAPIRRLFGRGLALPLPPPERAEVVSTGGNRDLWEVVWTVATSRPADAVAQGVAASVDERGSWQRAPTPSGGGAGVVAWTLGEASARFRGLLTATSGSGSVRLSLRLERQAA